MKENLCYDESIYTFDNQNYKKIKCSHSYYDKYAKREIRKGEIGGFVHISALDVVDNWIEKDYMIGAPVAEYGRVSINHGCKYKPSILRNFIKDIEQITDFYFYRCGVREKSIVNAIMSKSKHIVGFIDQIIELENKIMRQEKMCIDTDLISLWMFLGACLEAFLKVHITIFRKSYSEFNVEKIENIKSNSIIKFLFDNDVITEEERVVLEVVNANRNMIHFISNRPIHSYDKYCFGVEDMLQIIKKLYCIQKEYVEKGENI